MEEEVSIELLEQLPAFSEKEENINKMLQKN